MTDTKRIEALRAALLEIPAVCTESRRSPDLLAARVRATANAALRADDEAARQGEPSPEAREAASGKCPDCNGQGRVDRGGWQNDGHGRHEWVYLGRGTCSACEGSGLAAIRDELGGGA